MNRAQARSDGFTRCSSSDSLRGKGDPDTSPGLPLEKCPLLPQSVSARHGKVLKLGGDIVRPLRAGTELEGGSTK